MTSGDRLTVERVAELREAVGERGTAVGLPPLAGDWDTTRYPNFFMDWTGRGVPYPPTIAGYVRHCASQYYRSKSRVEYSTWENTGYTDIIEAAAALEGATGLFEQLFDGPPTYRYPHWVAYNILRRAVGLLRYVALDVTMKMYGGGIFVSQSGEKQSSYEDAVEDCLSQPWVGRNINDYRMARVGAVGDAQFTVDPYHASQMRIHWQMSVPDNSVFQGGYDFGIFYRRAGVVGTEEWNPTPIVRPGLGGDETPGTSLPASPIPGTATFFLLETTGHDAVGVVDFTDEAAGLETLEPIPVPGWPGSWYAQGWYGIPSGFPEFPTWTDATSYNANPVVTRGLLTPHFEFD